MFPKLTGIFVLALVITLCTANRSFAHTYPWFNYLAYDTLPGDSLRFRIYDTRADNVMGGRKSTYDFNRPSNIKDSVVYDPVTKRYIVYEKIGNRYYKTPTTYSFDEFWQLRGKQAEQEYFKKRANVANILNRKLNSKVKLPITDKLFNRLFGNGKVEIIPQGDFTFKGGYQSTKTKNPTLPERAQNNGGLDIDMNVNVNVDAKIGDLLKFPINYNSLANFGQDNQLKLDYTGVDESILKRFEAGNVNFPSRTTLIPGAQQLFGIKMQLQLAKLYITAVVANQKSQRQSMNLQGGAAAQQFEIKADEYEENRHFLLSQYFKVNYNKVMSTLPAMISPIQILRLEVWVTNRNGTTTETRDVVGLMDLGEDQPGVVNPVNPAVPRNNINSFYQQIVSTPGIRDPSQVFSKLTSAPLSLQPTQQFEKTFARKLDSTQYMWNRQAGYISINQPLQTDEVLAVAYQYSFNGKIYTVGEFSNDLPPDSSSATQKVLFLKLLKATSQRTSQPIWTLMMKNVYTIGYGSLQPQDFKLNVLYSEPGQGLKPYVPFGNKNEGTPLITLINCDRLNNQLDPQPDGVFDYVEGFTVTSQYSRIMFPVLEPFGRDLARNVYTTVPATAKDTLFYALYDSIKAVAQQYPNLNRFVLKGSAKTTGSSDISIGFNIPRGSVSVTAGGRQLQEGLDYDINYDLGTIKVTNQAIINAGLPVQVNYENNGAFGIIQRNYLGLRLDYLAKNSIKTQLSLGGTIVKLGERPWFTKVLLNEDPINNAMYGLDVNYKTDMPRLTKILDKLPFYSTTAPSGVNVYAEAAIFDPGHAKQIGKGSRGAIYIDDFEGAKSGYDLRFPAISWQLASTPKGATDNLGNVLFPEAELSNDIQYGRNRAKIAWYQIEPALQQYKGPNNPLANNAAELSDPRVRQVYQKEIFPQRTTGFGQSLLTTFDLSFYPTERGPYNYDATTGNVSSNGKLLNPRKRWGGLMRNIDQPDFETGNIEFIEFWMQDPFVNNLTNPAGGKLYFNLGNISEDILRDGKRFYENGLPTPNIPSTVDITNWGKTPRNPIQVTNAFSNDPNDRQYQDIGFDGLDDTAEANKRTAYLAQLQALLTPNAFNTAKADPSTDNYHHYRGNDLDAAGAGILTRYKNFNGNQGNSPINAGTSDFSSAATLYPDAEDVNRDNTMNETEEYFQYVVDILPNTNPNMAIGRNYIVDKKPVAVSLADGTSRTETWYQFRIPIQQYNNKVGSIPDFKSIRFMRMFMTDFTDSITLRFGALQLTRNIWRRYQYKIDTTGLQSGIVSTVNMNVGAVNIEENDQRSPLPYRTPCEIERQQTQSNNGVNLLLNEQSMNLQLCDFVKDDAKGVFQTFANRNLVNFGKLKMFLHAEDLNKIPTLRNRDLTAIVRLGSDFINNYYEIRVPLYLTPASAGSLATPANAQVYCDTLWNPKNSLDVDLKQLVNIKLQRDNTGASVTRIYRQAQGNGHTYSVMGSPNLQEIKGVLIAVENTNSLSPACAEVWINELRLTSANEDGGAAGLVRVDANLADLGTISLAANAHTANFGTLEQRINERYRDNFLQLDAALNLELGKLLPKSAGISIPVYAAYSQTTSSPLFDPVDMDVKLKDKLKSATGAKKDSIRNTSIEFNSVKTLNITNLHKNRTGKGKPMPYDISNFDVSLSYVKTETHTPLIENNEITRKRGVLGYNYAPQVKPIEPFKKWFKKNKTHWFDLIKDFNFNPVPNQLSFRADIMRQFGAFRPRSIGSNKYKIPETYDKYFTMQRDYILRWDLTKSLKFDFTAQNNSRVDEPFGRIDTKEKKDTLKKNFWDGGRNTLYNHTANFSYSLPTSKFPLLDWTTVNLKYQAGYRWIGASRLAVSLGNIIENTQQQEATAQLDFNRLYQKSKWLRVLDNPPNKADKERWKNRITKTRDSVLVKGKMVMKTIKTKDKGAMPYVSGVPRTFLKLLTSLKSVDVTLSENANTRLPGFTDSTKYFGQNWKSMQPGTDFILGYQPDTNWLNKKASKGLITDDTLFNSLFQQNFDQRLTITAQLEPIRDLSITVNVSKTFNKNYSETFKNADTSGGSNYRFGHWSPYGGGGFDVTYIAFKTLFGKFNPNQVSETFVKFQDYRKILSSRLGKANQYNVNSGNLTPDAEGYYNGYGKYATDVLIPAFIAAYTGQDPNTVELIKQGNENIKANPFRKILPKPNWQLTYNGLSRIKGLEKIFTNFSLSHGYTSNLSMNSFTSALLYQDVSQFGYPSFIDTLSKNYVPYFLIPNITIQEQFAPLIGLDMMFTNQMQAKFEYAKSRQLSMSLIDFQLSEQRSTEITIGAGYRKRELPMPFNIKLPKFLSKNQTNKLNNEINFRFDYRMRDNVTSNSRLDQGNTISTGGSREVTLSPSIDYFLSNKINIKLYYDRRSVKPYVPSSAPTVNTRAGVQIRVSLAQ